jgi:hypothetical protein
MRASEETAARAARTMSAVAAEDRVMPKVDANCAKCDGPMEEGFLLDHGHYNKLMTEQWVEGRPETSFWMGLKTSGKKVRSVTTTRCTRCGFLESYAF